LRILFIGDIAGKPGRLAVARLLPGIRKDFSPDFVIANGENAAGGIGISKDTALELFQIGADALTMGNHVWAKREVYPYLNEETRIVRPANYPAGAPGRGWAVYPVPSGGTIGVANLCGRVFMESLENPFRVADEIIGTLKAQTNVVLLDFHAEATSEKVALGFYLDGRASAVVGTHTHIQTADDKILAGGTAYISDVGMTGPVDSVIGVKKELILERFLTMMPNKFEIAEGEALLSAVLIDVDPTTGRATGIQRIQRSDAA